MSQSFKVILEQINQIGKAKGKDKETVMAMLPNPEEGLKPVIDLALNPFITFNVGKKTITKIESLVDADNGGEALNLKEAKVLLTKLEKAQLTGNAAINAICDIRQNHCEDSWELLKRILVKDLRGGFSAKTANLVWPGFIYLFELQLAHKYDAKKVKSFPVDGEIKHDGVRCAAEIDLTEMTVRMLSREGNEFTTFDSLKQDVLDFITTALPSAKNKYYLDGEIKSGEFNKTAGDIHRKDADIQDAYFHVFEFLTYDEFWNNNNTVSPQALQRRKRLQALFVKAGAELVTPKPINVMGVNEKGGAGAVWKNLVLVEQYELENDQAVKDFFAHFYSQGEEGCIVKPRYEIYETKRSNGYLKLKGAETVDLEIIGWDYGNPDTKFETKVGAVVVVFNGVEVRVSSGLTDEMRELGDDMIGRIIEVGYHEVTPDGSLRHPKFKRFRDTVKKGVKE